MVDTWASRDEPVLRAIVEMTDEGHAYVTREELAERTGMEPDTVRLAVLALAHEEPQFFRFHDMSTMGNANDYNNISKPTGHARRKVGTWPTPEALADRIVEGLLREADATEDPEQAGRLRRTAAWFGGVGRDVLVNVIGAAVGG